MSSPPRTRSGLVRSEIVAWNRRLTTKKRTNNVGDVSTAVADTTEVSLKSPLRHGLIQDAVTLDDSATNELEQYGQDTSSSSVAHLDYLNGEVTGESLESDQVGHQGMKDANLDNTGSSSIYSLGPLEGANADAAEYLANWVQNVQENNPGQFIIPKVARQNRKRSTRKGHVLNTSEFFPHWFSELPETQDRVSDRQDAKVHSELIVWTIDNETHKKFDWSESSDEDEDQYGPIPAAWNTSPAVLPQYNRNTRKSSKISRKKVALNAVIVEVEHRADIPEQDPTTAQQSTGSFSQSTKGKTVMEGEKPRHTSLPIDKNRTDPIDTIRKSYSTQHIAKETKVPPLQSGKHRSRFTREKSQIPSGGYFSLEGGQGGLPPSSSSSSSSDNTDSSSGNESNSTVPDSSPNDLSSSSSSTTPRKNMSPSAMRHRKDRRAQWKKNLQKTRKLLAGVQTKAPPTYTGIANLDILDQWTYAMDVWIEMQGLDNKWAVKLMINFLSDKASTFYMKHIALRQHRWSVQQVYEGLFDYCFPPDYKLELRKRLMTAYQGRKPVRDFARDIEALTKRFPDIPKRQRIQILWDGVQQYIRLEWVKAGYSPESTTWTKLVTRAARYEAAEQLRIKEIHRNSNGGRTFDPPQHLNLLQKGTTSPNKTETKVSSKKENESGSRDKVAPKKHRNPLTREELNQLRAEGRCFNCKQEGHDARNCPKSQMATAPKISTGSVRIAKLQKLANEKQQMETKLFAIAINTNLNNDLGVVAYAMNVPGQKRKMSRKDENTSHLIENVERTAMQPRDFTRRLPRPIVVEVFVNGKPARALLDSGSLADFMSTTIADQLCVKKEVLAKPLALQLAVHGSRSKINFGTTVELRYQSISGQRRFDIVNLDSYDLILGTPFIFQHKLLIGLNPTRVLVGSTEPTPIEGESVAIVKSAAADLYEEELDQLRQELSAEARDLCPDTAKVALPPLRAVNHSIPLINENKIYSWRPSRCPEALRQMWQEKKKAYIENGRWRIATGTNTSPLLVLPKPPKTDGSLRIRTVVDKRQQNSNTQKLRTPLPDIETILRNVVRHEYRSLIDGKDAYEQIRVIPEHVHRTLFTTPDGTMESLTLQQGDCNGPATYQTLMNHIFTSYLGVFMDVYLDDIVIYSDTITDHVAHIRKVFDVLRKEKLYLSPDKMNFFANKLTILGHVIDEYGIVMDTNKVNNVLNWKTPTNKGLLSSFIGAVGFLAGDCPGIRIPMAVLTTRTGTTRLWRWTATEQRAFEQIKQIVHNSRENHRIAISYDPKAESINLVTDACLTGGSGTLTQGNDLPTAKVIAFWSGKFSAAQQNYPVHEQELLAIIESLKRFRAQLLGVKFRIFTDHKALEYIMTQRHLSPRQHRWVDVLNEFDFSINYIPGHTNILADALSRIYSDEPQGVVRATSEYISDDPEEEDEGTGSNLRHDDLSAPVYTGYTVLAAVDLIRKSNRLANKQRVRWNKDYTRTIHNEMPSHSEQDLERRARILSKTVPEISRNVEPDKISETVESTKDLSEPVKGPRVMEKVDLGPIPTAENRIQENRAVDHVTAPNLTDVISEGNPTIQFPDDIRGKYGLDKFFSKILANPTHFRNFEVDNGLVFLKRDNRKMLCIPNIKLGTRSAREIIINHAHSILAHLGTRKTMYYIRENVWWPEMIKDVTEFCRSCSVCAMSKSSTQLPMGLLRTLEIPRRPWQAIGIDFVGPLPGSRNRYGEFDQICVIIDHLTCMVHLVPTRLTYKAKQMAEIIFEEVYKLHGLPERIISDRDSLFTSTFWRELHRLLGTELRLSSSYHPQTDGATERANRTMTQMLRQCVALDQKDWVIRLPAVEYAMNCARSDTTGFSPFFLNYGRMPRPLIWDSSTEYPGVKVFAQRMKDAIMSAHDEVIAARVKHTNQANRHRRKAEFVEGDLVYLSTKNLKLPKHRARKLTPKYIGPFKILKIVEPGTTYKLELSAELRKHGINPTFHASLLRIHVPNDDRRFPGRQLNQLPGFGEIPREWAVDRILSHVGRGTDADFEVLWTTGDVTWLPYSETKHLEALTSYCEAMGISTPNDLPHGKSQEQRDFVVNAAPIILSETYCGTRQRRSTMNRNQHIRQTKQETKPTYEQILPMTADIPSNSSIPKPAEAFFSAETLAILLDAQQKAYSAGAAAANKTFRNRPPRYDNANAPYDKRDEGIRSGGFGKRGLGRGGYKGPAPYTRPPANDIPLKDRVEPGIKHLPPPLGRRGPSKNFKSWSNSEANELTDLMDRLIAEFTRFFSEKSKVDKNGTHIDSDSAFTSGQPVAGPSGTAHTNDVLPVENQTPSQSNETDDEKGIESNHDVKDIEMEEEIELIGDETEPFLIY